MIKTTDFSNSVFFIGVLLATFYYTPQAQAASVSDARFEAIASSARAASKTLTFNASSDDFAGDERPGSRTSGGSRGPCREQLIALVPGIEALSTSGDTCATQSSSLPIQTVDDTPTFWFYVPAPAQLTTNPGAQGTTPARSMAEFVLFNHNGDILYNQSISLAQTAGIVAVQPPQSLNLNQPYQWVFSIVINPRNPSQNPTVDGWVRRIEPSPALSHDLAQSMSDSARIAAYANQGVWQDALTELAILRRAHPDDAALLNDWNELLNSVGLGAIANAPLLNP